MTESVDKITQKSVKLDPNAYEQLNETKKRLEKYLRQNMSSSGCIRWLIAVSQSRMAELAKANDQIELDAKFAKNEKGNPSSYRAQALNTQLGVSKSDLND